MIIKKIKNVDLVKKENIIKNILSHNNFVSAYECGEAAVILKSKNPFIRLHSESNNPYRSWLLTPYISEFNKKSKNHYSGNVLFIPFIKRYFHDLIEIFPTLITISKNDPDFKVVLIATNAEALSDKKIFLGMENNDGYKESLNFKYLKNFFNSNNIKFECVIAEKNQDFSSDFTYSLFFTADSDEGYTRHIPQIDFNHDVSLNIDGLVPFYPMISGAALIWDLNRFNILKLHYAKHIKSIEANKKIYISRNPRIYSDRSIDGYDALENYFKKFGYESVSLEDYSIEDQISITTSSEKIISLAGSGLLNTIFCNSGTQILSIHTDELQNFHMYDFLYAKYEIDVKNIYSKSNFSDIIESIDKSKSVFLKSFFN